MKNSTISEKYHSPSSAFCHEACVGTDRVCPGEHKMIKRICYHDCHDPQNYHNCHDYNHDYNHLDHYDHLVNDWFEQDIELGVVGQGCIVVVGKVCWFPVRQ